jgi:hypothetical protein
MSKDIKRKYIENQPIYISKLFDTIFNEQNIKNLYKIFVTKSINECSKMISYYEYSKLLYRGIDSYDHEKIKNKILKVDDWIEYLSSLDEMEIFKYCYIIENSKLSIKDSCYIYLSKIFHEICIILEIENKTPLLLL